VVTAACFLVAGGPWVRPASGIPRALFSKEGHPLARLGRIVPRECEVMPRVFSRLRSIRSRRIDASRASIDTRSGSMKCCCPCGDLAYSRSNKRLDQACRLG
jgi:hypothetical protein